MSHISEPSKSDSEPEAETSREEKEAAKATFRAAARSAILEHVKSNGRVTADDIRKIVEVPDGVHPATLGPVFAELSKNNIIKMDSVSTTGRPVAHGRICRVWKLANSLGREK